MATIFSPPFTARETTFREATVLRMATSCWLSCLSCCSCANNRRSSCASRLLCNLQVLYLVQQHGCELIVPHALNHACLIPCHELRIYFCNFLRDQPVLPGACGIGLQMECHRPQPLQVVGARAH